MIKNYFKIAWRNLWKHKFYTLINIFGLSLGIACSIILFQFITYHLSFDSYHHDAKKLYRVVNQLHFEDGVMLYDQGAPMVIVKSIKNYLPQINDAGILIRKQSFTVGIGQSNLTGRKIFYEKDNVCLTDAHWFNMFDYTWLNGTASSAFSDPYSAVITHKLAQKYFGTDDAVGRVLRLDNKYNFKVTGVLKDNVQNTDFKCDMFLSQTFLATLYPDVQKQWQENWDFSDSRNVVFLSLPAGLSPKTVENTMTRASGKDIAKYINYKLQPLNEVHFDGRYSGVIQKSLLVTLGLVGLLLIVIACVNFINMATAQSFKRAKEIGTRKVLGSTPSAIFFQFISETFLIVLFAALLATLSIFIFLPVLNSWLQTTLTFNIVNDGGLFVFIGGMMLLITAAAGFYPALILSRFKPVNALKNQIGGSSQAAGFSRKGLIVVQNIIAQVLIVGTIIITMQVRYLKTTDMGFDKAGVIMLPLPNFDKSKTDFLRNQLLANPAVTAVSYCYRAPSSTADKGGSIKFDTRDWEKFVGRTVMGDAGYAKTFGLKIIAGRNLAESDTAKEYLVNEKLMRKLGIKDPQQILGHQFIAGDLTNNPGTIVGVVKDFNAKSLYSAIEPEYISTYRKAYQYMGVRIDMKNRAAALGQVQNMWQSVFPDNVFEYHFLDEQIADFYQKEDLLNKLITSSAIIAIFISCLGLLGLISLLTLQRTKEIGIRKVLGASVANITALLSADFLKLVLIAIVVATPIAWLTMSKYLQNFAYRIDIQWWVFALAGMLAILIAVLTVGYQSLKSAMANPVDSLRNE
ncbi:putative ABC transport system permease protein [Mucilaginibacter pineti]|uniref:Putative ABC transport system permease protein n=1 Tax=Mucilaginibacter pineti TaxID=1391627 RepID=A0A1G6SXB7_9SPHI|nr:ABC transporter permease [Mucilaginibacter pineti]SDD21429.1 putative ABC transport system permease protein [Mucilaginibacter pineti]